MGNIAVKSEYLPIWWNKCIHKVQRKVSDTVDDNHAPGVIDGCTFVVQV